MLIKPVRTMIDHLSSYSTQYETSRDFYQTVFAPLGYELVTEFTTDPQEDPEFEGRRVCAFGPKNETRFWIIETNQPVTPRHIAFTAKSHDAVRNFHKAALSLGADDNGAPGLRPHYHANYYGAFVFDPDGNDIEAVCHFEP